MRAPYRRALLASAIIFGLAVFLPACSGEEPSTETASPADTGSAATSGAADTNTYTVRGVVQSITPSQSHVVVAHEAIPGFMDAMTMPFALDDTASIGGVAVGDSVRFTLSVSKSAAVVYDIQGR